MVKQCFAVGCFGAQITTQYTSAHNCRGGTAAHAGTQYLTESKALPVAHTQTHTAALVASAPAMQAQGGNGGAVSAALAGDARLTATDATFTNNTAASGGAMFLTGPTSGVAVGQMSCTKCSFKSNKAASKVGRWRGGGDLSTGEHWWQMCASPGRKCVCFEGASECVELLHMQHCTLPWRCQTSTCSMLP